MIRLLPILLLPACSVSPMVVPNERGQYAVIGGWSFLEKSAMESGRIALPDGTVVEFSKTGKDQTEVAGQYIGYKTLTGLAEIANGGEEIREKGETIRHGQDASVEKAKIQGDVTKATFVPPEP